MPTKPEASVLFWGVEDDVNSWGFTQFVATQLYGGNVGHAAIQLTLPDTPENAALVEKYLKGTGIPYKRKHRETKGSVLSEETGKVTKTDQTVYEEDVIEVYFSWWPGMIKGFSFHTLAQDYQGEREGVDRPANPEYAKALELEQRVAKGLLGDRIITLSLSTIIHTSALNPNELEFIEAYQKLQIMINTLSPWKLLIEKLNKLDKKKSDSRSKVGGSTINYNELSTSEKLLLCKLFPDRDFKASPHSLEEIITEANQQKAILEEVVDNLYESFNQSIVKYVLQKNPITTEDKEAYEKINLLKNVIDMLALDSDQINQKDIQEKLIKLNEMGYEISALFRDGSLDPTRKDVLQRLLRTYYEPKTNDTQLLQDKFAWMKVTLYKINHSLDVLHNIKNEIALMFSELKEPNTDMLKNWSGKIASWLDVIADLNIEALYKTLLMQDLGALKTAIQDAIENNITDPQSLLAFQDRLETKIDINKNELVYQAKLIQGDQKYSFAEHFGVNDFLEDVVRAASTPDGTVTLPIQQNEGDSGLALEPMLQMMQQFATQVGEEFNLVDRNCSVTTKSILAAGAGKEKAWIFEETGELMGTLFNPQSVYNSALLYQKDLENPIEKTQPSGAEQIVGSILYPFSYAAVASAAIVQSNDPIEKAKQIAGETTAAVTKYAASWVRYFTGTQNDTVSKTSEQTHDPEQTKSRTPGTRK